MNFWNKEFLGVDLGNRAIKGILLREKNHKVYLEQYFFHDLCQNTDSFPDTKKSQDILSAIVDTHNLKGKKSILPLKENTCESLEILLPQMPESELKLAIKNVVSSNIQYPIELCCYDYALFPRPGASVEKENLVAKIYYCHRNIIEKNMQIMDHCGLNLRAADISMLANMATLDFNGYLDTSGAYVMIDLGESHITTSLIINKQVLLSNTLPIGLGEINKTLNGEYSFSYRQSESIKLKLNALNINGATSVEIAQADQIMNQIVSETQRAIDYYASQLGDTKINGIFLVGGGSQTAGLCEVLNQHYKVQTVIANPFRNIEIFNDSKDLSNELNTLAPQMSLAVGLALWGIEY